MGKPKIFLSRARVCTRFVAKPFFSLFFSFLSFPGKTSEEMGITSEEMGITSEEMGITSEMNNAGLCGSAWFYK